MLEEVEDKIGDGHRRDAGGSGEASIDELLLSGVCPAKTHTYTQEASSTKQC